MLIDTGLRPIPADNRRFQRLLLAIGLAMLAIYAAARIHGAILSQAALSQFEAFRQPDPDKVLSSGAPQSEFALWSEKRIRGYQDSLNQHLAPPLAVLRISKLHLEVPVLEGTDDLTLNRGVGRIRGTAQFGNDGNVGIAGHRDGFFRGLKDINIGDKLDLEERNRTDTYVVDQLQIVGPNEISVLRPRSKPSLTLVTCYPFYFIGSAPQRYIVHASRTDSEPNRNRPLQQQRILALAK